MTPTEGVSLGTGAAVLAFFIAKLEIIEKIYSFFKKLFKEKATVNLENVGTVGDVAGRDMHKKQVDLSRRSSGDVHNNWSIQLNPVFERAVRLQFMIEGETLQEQLRQIWNKRDSSQKDWFTEYVNAVLDSEEFLDRLASTAEQHTEYGWELKNIGSFDNTWSEGKHGFHCMMTFAKEIPTRLR